MEGHLNSGEIYSLETVFSNDTNGKVVIPDLQRDYCWGGKGTLVKDFVNNIKKHFSEKGTKHRLMMGLLYGYYEENRPNLQLCDGQQRLTTLFLLMGYINRACGDNSFRRFLISDYELNEDDREPNLLYDIRDSSLYFLSDLVCNFFIQEGGELVDGSLSEYIKKQDWWFKRYDADPTILSMLAALDEIQCLLQDMDQSTLKNLGCYVCSMLQFVFFDMGDRKNGEETFVIINTTGEPLTATENLKPLIVTQGNESEWEENSRKWEEMDHWFWLHRDKSQEDTSDAGMKEFLRWVVALSPKKDATKEKYYQWFTTKDYVFPLDIPMTMTKIEEVFKTLKLLNDDDGFIHDCGLLAAPKGKVYDLKEYFVLLPTLKYAMKFWGKETAIGDWESIRRIYRFFRNLSRYTEISTENNNVLLALKAVDCMNDKDVCCLLDLEEQVGTTYILTEEEKTRLTIIRKKKTDKAWRKEVEKAFEEISQHPVLSGRISCLIDDIDSFDFKRFEANVKRFESLFQRPYENVAADKTVLAFAAFCQEQGSNAYPMVNGNYRDFGYYASEWNRFIYGDKNHEKHIKLFRDFLHEIDERDAEASKNNIISRLSTNHLMYHLITKNRPCALKNGEWRKRLSIHPTSGLIRLFQNTSYRSDKDIYLLGQEILPCRSQSGRWSGWNFYEDGEEYCLYTDHKEYDVAMDLLFEKVSDNQYRLRIFKRNNTPKADLNGLESLLAGFSPQSGDGRMVSKPKTAEEIICLIDEMEKKIEKKIESHDD